MKKLLILFIVLTSLVCCKRQNIGNIENTEKISIPEQKENFDQQEENFETFFEHFTKDSVFQKQRIEFPLAGEIYDTDLGSFEHITIKANEWTFEDFSHFPDNYSYPDNYSKEIRKNMKKDEYVLHIGIDDTGYSVNYIFHKKNGKWFLVKILDDGT